MVVKREDQVAASTQPVNQRTVPAFPGLFIAGELDDLLSLPLEVSMTEDWLGYWNARVMDQLSTYYTARPTFLQFVPDPEQAEVIILAAKDEDDYGAQEVKYSETEKGAWVNLRLPMKALQVTKAAGRVRIFPVGTRVGADGRTYLTLSVKGSRTRPVKTKKETETAKSEEEQSK